MEDIMKIVKFLRESGLLNKVVREIIENEAKEQIGDFLNMVGASLLGNLLTGKSTIRAGEEAIRAGETFQCHLIL